MSIVEKLLDQKVIIYSLIAIGLLMLVVLLLIMIGQVTTIMAKRRRQKARLQMRQQLTLTTPITAMATLSAREGMATSISPNTASSAPTGDTAKPAVVATVQLSATSTGEQITADSDSTVDSTQGSTPSALPEAQVSSAMQDILSSVFIDEDVVARYEVLLRGQQHVDITDLLVFSRKVVAQLRTRLLDIEARTGRG